MHAFIIPEANKLFIIQCMLSIYFYLDPTEQSWPAGGGGAPRRAAHLLDLRGKAAHPERVHRALDLRRHGGAGGPGARSRAAVGGAGALGEN